MSSVYTAIISALVGGICTLIITLIAIKVQRGKKIIEYSVVSMPLFRFKPIEGALTILVDKHILTNNEIDKGKSSEIDNAFGFQVELFNVGNEDIENPNIEITLDRSAKIVGYEIQPTAKPGYDIKLHQDNSNPNIVRFQVSYINKNSRLIIRLISTENLDRECKVEVVGLGIRTLRHSNFRAYMVLAMVMILPILVLIILNFLVPDSVILQIGGQYEISKIARYPLWVHVFEYIIGAVFIIGFFIFPFIGSSKKQELEWDVPKKKGKGIFKFF